MLDSNVLLYIVCIFEELNVKRCEVNEDWLDFISKNRTIGGLNHNYDIVIGLVVDDTVFNVIDTYLDGDYTKDEAIKRLKAWKCENQISFHTYKSIKRLNLVRWEYAD